MSEQNAAVQSEVVSGDGYAAGNISAMGEGPGFRKVRKLLGVNEMGVNAIVMPPGIGSGTHWHERQEEVYFVHQGTVRFTLGENAEQTITLGPGGVLRVDASTHRSMANPGEVDAIYICFGAEGGYVGRDGQHVEGEPRVTTI